jgi:hypothetical protein
MQTYTSKSLEGLDYKKKYKGLDYTNSLDHLIIFGMYREEDFDIAKNHKGELTVVWCGSDAKDLSESWIDTLRKSKHISISHFIEDKLNSLQIANEYKPINAVIKEKWDNYPNGDCVYFYSSDNAPDVYGEDMVQNIERLTGVEVIRTTYGMYNKTELFNIYKKCFLNLRLTKFDGCPNTNIEMGLMGRKSIFNGNLPNSIKWNSVDDIYQNIMKEYNLRQLPNKHVTESFKTLEDGM